MRILHKTLYLPLAALALFALSACDQSEQNYEIVPGDSLSITGPSEVAVPEGEASFNIFPFTIQKDYEWSIEGPGEVTTSTREGTDQENEYFDVTLDEPGTYTVTVNDGEYVGETTFTAFYPEVGAQASRLDYGALATAVDAAGLADTLAAEGPYTLLAPTDEAFLALLDDDEDEEEGAGTIEEDELPGTEVLADLLQYHIIPGDSLTADELAGNSYDTFAGPEVSFEQNGDELVVNDGQATVTEPNIPASNGIVHGIDGVLLPPTASASFDDQESEGSSVVVRSVYLPEGGFVAIHDTTLLDGNVAGSVIGVSEELDAGLHNRVEVELFDVPGQDFDDDMTLDGDQVLIAMPHRDTNDNEVYDFITSDGDEDGAYTRDGGAVTDDALITVTAPSDN